MKLKHIALAVLAATGINAANAAISTTVGGAELYFVAYDYTNGTKSFNFDTGVNVSSLINGTINYTTSFAADANWTSFVSSVGASNITWYVEAIQNGASGSNTKFAYATLGADQVVGSAGSNTAFNSDVTNAINSLAATTISAGQSEIAANGTSNYLGAYDQFKSLSIAQLSNVIGTSNVGFFGAANSKLSGVGAGSAKETIFAAPTALASFTANGTLTIGTPLPVTPSVPEPESYGLALVGLLLAGAVARRRAA
jgi:MYXO-CTERM domain-containing protein